MAYNVNTKPLDELQRRLADLPRERPGSSGDLSEAITAFVNAFDCLLRLMQAILSRIAESKGRATFLPIFETARANSVSLLRNKLLEPDGSEQEDIIEMIYDLRDSLLAEEFVAVAQVMDAPEREAPPEEDAETAKTAIDSVKEFITRYIPLKKLKSILHTINELIALAKGG
jgi:hypothetical protein